MSHHARVYFLLHVDPLISVSSTLPSIPFMMHRPERLLKQQQSRNVRIAESCGHGSSVEDSAVLHCLLYDLVTYVIDLTINTLSVVLNSTCGKYDAFAVVAPTQSHPLLFLKVMRRNSPTHP